MLSVACCHLCVVVSYFFTRCVRFVLILLRCIANYVKMGYSNVLRMELLQCFVLTASIATMCNDPFSHSDQHNLFSFFSSLYRHHESLSERSCSLEYGCVCSPANIYICSIFKNKMKNKTKLNREKDKKMTQKCTFHSIHAEDSTTHFLLSALRKFMFSLQVYKVLKWTYNIIQTTLPLGHTTFLPHHHLFFVYMK